MNDYQAKRSDKIARYRQYAENAQRRADAAFKAAHDLADMIPLGQPILVGHHSERRARRDQSRIQGGMERGIEEQKKAAYWRGRVLAMESDTSISKHDPEAVTLLREKIAALEAKQARYKEINRRVRKRLPLDGLGLSEKNAAALMQPDQFTGRVGLAPYLFSNLSANIRRYKQRLAELDADARRPR